MSELSRTSDQRRADALAEMAVRSATVAKDGRRPKPLITVVAGAARFAQLLELGSGEVVPPAAVVPLLGDAEIEAVLFDESGTRAIKASRRRLFTGILRRVIEVRDRQCFHEFCQEPADRCQVDHIQPWAEGGMTSQENGRMACGFHNRGRHQRRGPPDDDEVP